MKNINTKEYWNKIWEKEAGIVNRIQHELFENIRNVIGTNNKVLDIGAGNGLLAFTLQCEGNKISIVDISDFAVERMVSVYGFEGKVARVPPIPYKDKEFDFVIATEFLEHFNSDEINKVVAECSRVAHTSIFSVPDDYLGHEDWAEHYQKFTETTFKELLEKHFKRVEVKKIVNPRALWAVCYN